MQVELPLGATEDRICGTIDVEKALQAGVKAYEPGLLVSPAPSPLLCNWLADAVQCDTVVQSCLDLCISLQPSGSSRLTGP